MAIETASRDSDIHTIPLPTIPTAMDFKSQLEAKDVFIVHL
jgi:hypothetical protein